MKRKRHTPEQIIRKLRTAEQLVNRRQTVADVSAPTDHRCLPAVHLQCRRRGGGPDAVLAAGILSGGVRDQDGGEVQPIDQIRQEHLVVR